MKLSIIVPIYNSEQTISKCIKSILVQTFKDFEILCINDGSTDQTRSILTELAAIDNRVKIIDQPNSGVATARNTGLQNARGEYIGFVDSDDKISETMFETLVHTIESDKVDLVMCGSNLIDVSGKKFDSNDMNLLNPKLGRKFSLKKEDIKAINVFLWNKLFKKRIIDSNQIRFPDGMWYEDSAFVWCYLTSVKSMSYVPEKLYHYHRISTSIMGHTHSRSLSRALDHLRICEFVSEYIKKNPYLRESYKNEFLEFCLANFIGSLIYAPSGYKISCFKQLVSILKKHNPKTLVCFCKLVLKKMAKRIRRMI